MNRLSLYLICFLVVGGMYSCKQDKTQAREPNKVSETVMKTNELIDKVNEYATVKLTSNLDGVSDEEKKMLVYLLEASEIMDGMFAYQSYGDLEGLLTAQEDEAARAFIKINYGPWDRLDNDKPFIDGVGTKPNGANYYPADMTKEEFAAADLEHKDDLYSFIRRDENGNLYRIPYHEFFKDELKKASDLLRKASELSEDNGFAYYLKARADALETDDFYDSDLAWMDMRSNEFDLVIGPIETYEDQLFGYKAAYEATLLHKDKEWSSRLAKYAAFLQVLQENLPVDAEYKQEKPGLDSDLNAYDIIYYAGASNAGGKAIAVNLPNDEKVQLEKGTRRLQLKNAMQAKFDKILVPISDMLITPEQRKHINFDAFFANTMFHEVAHGLGIKNTINGKGTVRKALEEHASALEEGKADILGLYMVEQLLEMGEMDGIIEDYYVTFIAGIFRSVRFGAGEAHGVANMVRFNFFEEHGAFERQQDGTYKVNFEKTREAVKDLSNLILTLQGNGDYDAVDKLVKESGTIHDQLQEDLDRLKAENIPVDVVFEQGRKVLGL